MTHDDILPSLEENFRKEEKRNEMKINRIRMLGLLVIFTVEVVTGSFLASQYMVRYAWGLALSGTGLALSVVFYQVLRRPVFHPWLKYLATAADYSILLAYTLVVRFNTEPGLYGSTADVPALYGILLVNMLSGLRYGLRLSLFCAVLSCLLIPGVHVFDYYYFNVSHPLLAVKIPYLLLLFVSSSLISAYIGLQARKMIVSNYYELEEMSLAQRIQRNFIPRGNPNLAGVTVDAMYLPMKKVGGDFYDFITFDECRLLGVFIGDVSGHGVPAALITGMIKALMKTTEDTRKSPAAMLRYLNGKSMGITGSNFFTAFYGICDLERQVFRYARGGHPPPFLIRRGGEIVELGARGRFLGIMGGADFEEREIRLEPGDKIIMYTDGLIEATNPSGEEYESSLVKRTLADNSGKSVGLLLEQIHRDLLLFRGGDRFDDDICIVGVEIR